MDDIFFNTGESQNYLRELYNPDGSDLRNAQLRMLSMLKYLDEICTRESIAYRIDSGTVLGAVRHKGFIPWDDDVDVVVNRHDLPRLQRHLQNNDSQFVLQTHSTDPGYFGQWIVLRDTKSEYIQDDAIHKARKYRGLQIDIFPVDYGNLLCLQKLSAKLQRQLVDKAITKGHHKIASLNWHLLSKIIFPFFRCFSLFGDTNYSSYSYGSYWLNRIPNSTVLPYTKISFEGIQVMGPANPETYLTIMYNDYTKLPDIKDRNPHQAAYRFYD